MEVDFSVLVGKKLIDVEVKYRDLEAVFPKVYNDEIIFTCDDGSVYRMIHYQDCCENVSIEDITGSLEDMIGSVICQAEMSSNKDEHASDSATWTFYRIASATGFATIRWYGESNGYYSEEVGFAELVAPKGE